MASNKFPDIAAAISQNVSELEMGLKAQKASLPSFEPESLEKYPEDKSVQKPRQALIELAMDLYHLAMGPGEYIKQQVFLVWCQPFGIRRCANIW
jgi:hypothetical protein